MEIENFFGCYLLYSLNERYKGQTYIGFTVDPNRRIKQHNRGLKAGGAWKTNNKGPWEMVLIVHGFPNDVSALRFEWAWQHPEKSRRLNHLSKKQPREKNFNYRFRVMSEMLTVGPWNRLPLTVQWLNPSYQLDFSVSQPPPLHIPICFGLVTSHKVKKDAEESNNENTSLQFCSICHKLLTQDDKKVFCLQPDCNDVFHMICMAEHFLSSASNDEQQMQRKASFILPLEGSCPSCKIPLLWGDLMKYISGCYRSPDGQLSQKQ